MSNNTQFTDGPWVANIEKRPAPAPGHWYVILDANEDGLGEFYGADHEENAANARLAAAAPDLLRCAELLDGLCAWLLNAFGPDSPAGKEAAFRAREARAALSKALGGQS